MTVRLDGTGLTVEQVVAVARERAPVELAGSAVERMRAGRAVVERVLAEGRPVYGVTTGVGVRRRVAVPAAEVAAYNRRLIADHRIATGGAAPDDVVRAAMVRLVNGFCTGTPGVRPELAELVVEALNAGRTPRVRMLGSAGEGDLAPMADLADGLLAGGGFEPGAREGLALLNTGAFSTGLAALALHDAERLLDAATVCGALDLEGFAANPSPLDEVVGAVRPHPGLVRALAELRAALAGSALLTAPPRALQDPLSFRNLAPILGAAREAAAYGRARVAVELNASQENPIVDVDGGRMLSVANFELLPLSQALDVVRLGLAPVLTSANERMIKLLQAPLTGLTDGLQPPGTTHHNGLSELAWAGQAIAPEARLLAQPVSIEIASSSQAEGIEDRISLAPLSARRTREMVGLGERLLAIGLVVACEAVDLRGLRPLGAATAGAHALVREAVPGLTASSTVGPDLEQVRALVASGRLRPTPTA
jgi:histidine ammonia-lyase